MLKAEKYKFKQITLHLIGWKYHLKMISIKNFFQKKLHIVKKIYCSMSFWEQPHMASLNSYYNQISNIRHTLGNKIVDHSGVVGASPVGVAPTISSFSI